MTPGLTTYDDFWTVTFGAPDDSRSNTILINELIRDFSATYNQVDNLPDVLAQERSFYWDNINQVLYYHIEHEYNPFNMLLQIGQAVGFSDQRQVYIDNVDYSPVILDAPSVAQQQDIVNYDQLALVSGSARLNNSTIRYEGELIGLVDFLITQNVYGNTVFLYYLDEDLIEEHSTANRTDLVPIAAFYVEDYDVSLQDAELRLQDIRKSQDVDILSQFFSLTDYPDMDADIGEPIPKVFGTPREAKAYKTNDATSSGDVTYRVAKSLTALGTVQVDIDGVWTNRTPTATSLSTGEFTLSSADGRNSNGGVYDCRVVSPTGYVITYTSDIIKLLNEQVLGIEYLVSNYVTTEWESEETVLSSGGIVFDTQVKLYEAIRMVQQGSVVGFRYEIYPDGRRTIRIDDDSRAVSRTVEPPDYQNRSTLPVTTDSDLVFSAVRVKHSKSWNSGRFLSVIDDTYSGDVLADYGSRAVLSVETILNNSTDADSRAATDAERFKDIPKTMTIELMGKEFLDLRIYDILYVQATNGFVDADGETITGRQYYGLKNGKVLSVNPDLQNAVNTVTVKLLERP
jgi:hypothetical protein